MKKIPLSRVFINDEVREAALRALNSGSYILSKECEAFEEELADYIGTKYAVLCSSWTAGGFLLHRAMGLKQGDEILVPSHTAFPTIEPMLHFGAKPVFIDIDETYCLDVDLLEASITPRTVGILPVHLYGHPANLDRVFEVARKHALWAIQSKARWVTWPGRSVLIFSFEESHRDGRRRLHHNERHRPRSRSPHAAGSRPEVEIHS